MRYLQSVNGIEVMEDPVATVDGNITERMRILQTSHERMLDRLDLLSGSIGGENGWFRSGDRSGIASRGARMSNGVAGVAAGGASHVAIAVKGG